MKRSRSEDRSVPHKCPYSGCVKQFRSARLLARHASVHTAGQPLSCTNPDCKRTFAYASERHAHVQGEHTISQKAEKEGRHVLDGCDDDHVHKGARSDRIDVDLGNASRDSQLEDEADEIASNAAYLASQMRVARIAQWHDEDYRNALQWALWVQESVEDFPDVAYLEGKMNEKGLSMTALTNAERAFFDSVLAYEGFNQDILNYLLRAALTIDGKEREADDAEARMRCLSAAITCAIERKKRLRVAADLAEQLHTAAGLELGDETMVARAEILLSRHMAWDSDRVRKHVEGLDVRDMGVFEVICHEAVIAHDTGIKFRDALFDACRRGIRDDAGFEVSAKLMAEVCERDVSFFDAYFSWLLRRLGWTGDSTQAIQGNRENVEKVKNRIKSLAQRKGPIGYITRSAAEDFARRTGMKDLVTW